MAVLTPELAKCYFSDSQILSGEIPERSKGADCKSVGSAFEGSNPSLPIPATMMDTSNTGDWYHTNGLRFSCSRCSCCCRFDSGYVWLTRSDLDVLARRLRVSPREFVDRYCRFVRIGSMDQLSLTEQNNYDCVFWRDGGCEVYDSRPVQCRSYPFWRPHLGTPGDWAALEKSCPGVNIGRQYSGEEIERLAAMREEEVPLSAGSLRELGL